VKPSSLVLVGGGEHARVVLDAARSRPDAFVVLGYADLREQRALADLGVAWLGTDDAALSRRSDDTQYVLAIGSLGASEKRVRAIGSYVAAGAAFATVVHSSGIVAPTASLAPGAVVMAGAIINPGASVGAHAVVNTGAVIEHDVVLGDFVQVSPRAVLGGGVHVGDGAFIGLGACIRDHIRIGGDATVGMGAVVLRDVAHGSTVGGVPARLLKTRSEK
jgi:acetyltransferase EpsM